MNIINIAIEDAGGAGIAAYRLHKIFKMHGNDSKLFVLKKNTSDIDVEQIIGTKKEKKTIFNKIWNRLLKILKIRKLVVSDPKYCFNGQKRKTYFNELVNKIRIKPDVIILYWVTYFLDAEDIYNLYVKYKVPIIWYLMDMAPLTGGCHYAWDCTRYRELCGSCPAIYSDNRYDITSQNMEKKLNYLSKIDISLIAASGLLEKQIKSSYIFKDKPIYKIMLSVDDRVFSRKSKVEIREQLELPINAKIIFFGSDSMSNERKGLRYLLDALNIIREESELCKTNEIFLLIAGKLPASSYDAFPFRYKFVKYLKTDEELVQCYSAADVFVCSSIQDSGPMMINESLMCGTPVVAFDMGIANDVIIPGKTGYIAKLKDSIDLAKGIELILSLNLEEYSRMSDNCRKLAEENFHPDKQFKDLDKVINILKQKVEN